MSKKEKRVAESAEPTDQQCVADDQATATIIMEETDSDPETPQSYNKLKYHSSKMDLNLRILRDEMANLQDSGNSLSRQFASMYRTFQEMKGENEGNGNEGNEDECADYDQYSDDDVDSQCAEGSKDDGLDTEDDVNRMSDLETDYSSRSTATKRKKQLKRPPPLQLETQENRFDKDPNGNEIRPCSPLPEPVEDTDQAQNSDFYPDFDTSSSEDCSHCLCCSSLASYSSGMPWKYVDKSASAQEYDSDSSEDYSDLDDASPAAAMPLHKRLSPFFYQDCYAEVEDGLPLSDEEVGVREKSQYRHGEESVPEKRMSPLGCESPNPASSRGSSQVDLDKEFNENLEHVENKAFTKNNIQSLLPSKTKEQNINGHDLESTQRSAGDQAKEDVKTESKASTETAKTTDELIPSADDEANIMINIKDRIKNFEAQQIENTTTPFKRTNRSDVKQTNLTNVNPIPATPQSSAVENKKDPIFPESSTSKVRKDSDSHEPLHVGKEGVNERNANDKVKPPPVKSKPQNRSLAPPNQGDCRGELSEKRKDSTPRHVSKSTFRVKTPGGKERERSGNQETKRKAHASSTIEIPVQYLSSTGFTTGESDALTFQVRPFASNIQGPPKGPLIITSSPQPKRKITKQLVQLAPCVDDVSEQLTLRPEPQGGARPYMPVEGIERHHPICPHCHKKAVPPEERKRNFQVLQLQPVSDTELPPTPTTPTPQTSVTFEAPQPQQVPPARIIKVIPSGGQQLIMQRQPSEEPSRVHLRLNMGGPQGVPIKIGDFIRIPLKPGQARGVRVIFN